MKEIIEVNNISKSFKNKKALEALTFTVKEGEIFGFLGPSGAGKTTTIKILTSQLLPSSGEAKILGKSTNSLNKDIFYHIGILTDNSGVYERLSVFDNLKLFSSIYGLATSEIDEILTTLGLIKDKSTIAKKLSKGMRQRLILARAVIHKPKLLFLDEPTSSLDPGLANDVHKYLKKLNKNGTTIFLTTHNMEEADKLCHRVAFLNDGKIVELDNPENLKLKYSENKINILLKNSERLEIDNNAEGGKIIKELMEKDTLLSIHSKEPSLEDIFLKLTGRDLA